MLSTHDLKVRLESTLASLESDTKHVENEIHLLNQKIDTSLQKRKAWKKEGKFMTEDAGTKQIEELHFKQKTQSLSLQQEKKLLKDIEAIKAKVRAHGEYEMLEESFKKMLNKRNELMDTRKMKAALISEAKRGRSKLDLAEYYGVSPRELVSLSLSVHKDRVKYVVGRQFATLKCLEETHHVIIEEQEDSADASANVEGNKASGERAVVMVITGTAESCNVAKCHIDRIARTVEKIVHIGKDLANVLNLQQSGTEQTHADMISFASNVTILVYLDKDSVSIRGTPEAIEKAKNMIQSVNYCSMLLFVEARDLPAVMGTKGTRIRSLEKDHNVKINVKRETASIVFEGEDGTSSGDGQKSNNSNNLSSTHEVSVLGSRVEDVKAALESIKAIIADNEMVKQCIELPYSYIALLLRNLPTGGLRDIEKSVRFIRLWIKDDKENSGIIWCSGPKYKVSEALPLVYVSAALAQSLLEEVNVSLNMMGAIIGKRGTMINGLREAHPKVCIMLDKVGHRVIFHSTDESARTAARLALMEVISMNQIDSVELGSDVAIMLKSKLGTIPRNSISDLGVYMTISRDTVGTIQLRGKADNIQEAVKILLEFKSRNQLEIIQVCPEDMSTIPMVCAELRQNLGISTQYFKDKLELHVRGTSEQLAEARSYVHKILHGDNVGGFIAFVSFEPEVIGLLIGKGGRQIGKMKEELGVSIEVVSQKEKSRVRIRGDPKKVAEAKAKIKMFVENTSITTTVDIASMYKGSEMPPPFTRSDVSRHCETIGNIFKIAVIPDPTGESIQMRGMSRKIVCARYWLSALLTGIGSIMLPISGALNAEEAAFAVERLNAELNNAGQSSGAAVVVKLANKDGTISIAIEGETSIVQEAAGKAYKILEGLFPGRFASVFVIIGALDLSIGTPRAIRTAIEVGEGKVEIFADYMLHCVHIRGKDPHCFSAAVEYLETVAKAWMAANAIVTFEMWMASLIIGKYGASIKEFSEKHSVVVRVDKNALSCFISDPRKTQRRAFISDTRRNSPRVTDSNEDGGGGSSGLGGGGSDNVIQTAAHALRKITDKMYKTNGCPLPDPQAIFSGEKGNKPLKMVEYKTGASCISSTQPNTVTICGDKASVLDARAILKEIMENGLDEYEGQYHDGRQIKSADVVDPPSSPPSSSLLSNGHGDVPVPVTSPPPSSAAARELPVSLAMVRLDHRVADVVGNIWATEGSGGITTSKQPKAADSGVSSSCSGVDDFHYQTEKVPPPLHDTTVVVDAQYSALKKQGPEHVPSSSILFGETATRQQPSMSASVSKSEPPDKSSSLPDRSNSAVQRSKTMGDKTDSEKPAALYEEKGSWYFESHSGLRVRLN